MIKSSEEIKTLEGTSKIIHLQIILIHSLFEKAANVTRKKSILHLLGNKLNTTMRVTLLKKCSKF